ncbi:T9SS type A sorting domain-containing protein [candidate division KSB1 bacterium]|nr:T9SS type A sorting domain-containing protein [candidate division KSB1 bacterium]
MKIKCISLISACFIIISISPLHAAIRPIADVRQNDVNGVPVLLGQQMTISGEVTVSAQHGNPSCIQDSTAGVMVYDFNFMNAVSLGDSVVISGTVDQYNGLTELANVTIIEQYQKSPSIVPLTISCNSMKTDGKNGIENYEGKLVRIDDVSVNTGSWSVSGSGANYVLTDASGTCEIRIDKDCNIANTNAPTGLFSVIGVVSQYDYSSPYNSGYQLMPRFTSDIITSSGPMILEGPLETEIHPESIRIEWTTDVPAIGILRYGTSASYEIDSLVIETETVQHAVTISDLIPATIYHIVVGGSNSEGINLSGDYIVSTASPDISTGVMNVYFTRSVDQSVALDEHNRANGNVDVEQKFIERIKAASSSIDLCFYSWNLEKATNALIEAFQHEVRIRFIYDSEHDQYQLNRLKDAGIPVIDNSFGINTGNDINHNKFAIFDAHHDSDPANDWVWTGSLNMTDASGLGVNAMQNVIEIQDQALARAYTIEFEEMWGSNTQTPNASFARFSTNKTNNTPHRFIMNGSLVESYFSPSDKQTGEIIRMIQTADYGIKFCIFAFTRIDIEQAMQDKYRKIPGFFVQGVFDKDYDPSSQYPAMHGTGTYAWDPPADVFLDTEAGILHHKYMLIDANQSNSDPIVITGSANWSSSAENVNDENTLMIHNERVANQYLQEFSARYVAAGGVINNVENQSNVEPTLFRVDVNYPNPFNASTLFPFELAKSGLVTIQLFNINGQLATTIISEVLPAGQHTIRFHAGNLPSGIYFCKFNFSQSLIIRKIVLLR